MIKVKRFWLFGALAVSSLYCSLSATTYTINVNAGSKTGSWNKFYERAVASDHMYTVISTAYGRNISNALKKAHAEAGFQYVRGHGILDDDVKVYSEDAQGNAAYSWTNFDKIYDSISAAGMKPMVEIGFMPGALTTSPTPITSVWYNNVPGNSNAPKDWNKWKALISALVSHCETRYGVAEVRNNWFFELWNEPNWMYASGGGDNGYLRLYDSTAVAVTAIDSLVKLGGPSENGGAPSAAFIQTLITHCRTNNKKLNFVTYHRYSNDFDATGTHDNDAFSVSNYHKTIVDACKTVNFTGPILCTEWGSSYTQGRALHDNEMAASFIAKTIHLINSNDSLAYPPPYVFGWWAISDVYEETNNTGGSSAFAGCYGLLTRGSSSIPQSWDVAKPAFNAFKLLHMLGSVKLNCTGGTTASPGVNAVATISASNDTISVLVYSHVDNSTDNSATSDDVTLTISGIPSVGATAKMEHWVVDRTHSNSYQTWVGLNSPANPNATQWTQIANSAQLAHYDSAATVTLSGTAGAATYTKSFTQNHYSVGLIQLTNFRPTAVTNPEPSKINSSIAITKSNISIIGKSMLLSLPYSGLYTINLFSTNGRKEKSMHANGPTSNSVSLSTMPSGTYLLECSGLEQNFVKTVFVGK